ncbi:L,D-transpeptidase [Chenggangzhangella methanolivorans]|uniref:L,D-transpeptidase n=1 Tax=Chenggangzhangella methanolivorans TaxID=1437009 RepID=A0A9E6UQ05_9HYPH|nr:L,D-transpeptidase [Chenggangzhangella methanolivorans]
MAALDADQRHDRPGPGTLWSSELRNGRRGRQSARAARALFKDGKDTYRIHGTTEPNTIGKAVSSGCIRMLNQDVIDLYGRVPRGSKVVVL